MSPELNLNNFIMLFNINSCLKKTSTKDALLVPLQDGGFNQGWQKKTNKKKQTKKTQKKNSQKNHQKRFFGFFLKIGPKSFKKRLKTQ